MKIYIIAVGNRMPEWVRLGFGEYAKRMTGECRVELVEIAIRGRKNIHDIHQSVRIEGDRMIRAVPSGAHVVALDLDGSQWSTAQLAESLSKWMEAGRDIALLVGGPDGLSPECKAAAGETWTLSKLTFPHALVRVIVVEQLYRAWSLLRNHPYHRQ